VIARVLAQRFARLATDVVVRRPRLWRAFRRPLRFQFDRLAPVWDTLRSPGALSALEAALDALPAPPRRVLDLGTGTGAGALAIAARFPGAQVVGVDLSPAMVDSARRKTPPELAARVRFEVADASRLPLDDGSFELVVLANMIPFFDELARVVAPGGAAVFSFSRGAETPIYVPPERLRAELERRGFCEFSHFRAGAATALLAERAAGR
jgi:ubiquinone/menaquinone biosynthesis C-methylase UbiE